VSENSITTQPKRDMNQRTSIGVIGCGYWGPNLIRNFSGLPGASMQSICDLNADRLRHLKTLYPDVEVTTDYRTLLTPDGPEAIAVAVPVKYHYSVAKECLLAGKHVLVEKPLASSSQECLELAEIAEARGLTLMVGHTFLYSAAVRKMAQIVWSGDIGEVRCVTARRLNLGLYQKDINVAWDLAPHDISIILYILGEFPQQVNCQGNAHVTPGVEDVTNMSLTFRNNRFATIQSSWLEPRKVREMTIVGTRRMIVYDDLQTSEKIRIYDMRVERPPHYDTFAEFHYSYHYGDSYIPHIKQEEPLKVECLHFLECIQMSRQPQTCGRAGADLVRILEASSRSLQMNGAAVTFLEEDVRKGFNPRWVGSTESLAEAV
jgi:predicted dehydrogenase